MGSEMCIRDRDKTASVEAASDTAEEQAETTAVDSDKLEPKRRRKAPKRSAEPETAEAVDAAE